MGTPWLVSWRALEKITSVEHYAISGVYYREGVAKIEKTLKLTRKGSVVDVLVAGVSN